MYIGEIKTPSKETLAADNSEFLNVPVAIFKQVEGKEEKEYVETKNLSFPLGTKPEEVRAEVDKYVAMLNSDLDHAEKNKEREAAHKQADETIAAFTPKESN